MAIGNVIQRGQTVYVYDDKGRQVSQHCAGSGGSVTGYTSTTGQPQNGLPDLYF
jgi:hypothetical protein